MFIRSDNLSIILHVGWVLCTETKNRWVGEILHKKGNNQSCVVAFHLRQVTPQNSFCEVEVYSYLACQFMARNTNRPPNHIFSPHTCPSVSFISASRSPHVVSVFLKGEIIRDSCRRAFTYTRTCDLRCLKKWPSLSKIGRSSDGTAERVFSRFFMCSHPPCKWLAVGKGTQISRVKTSIVLTNSNCEETYIAEFIKICGRAN